MKYIGHDFAKKDWVNQDHPDTPADRKKLYTNAIRISLIAILILLLINYS